MEAYLPYIYVFLSGIGFSIQALIQKILSEHNFHDTFESVFVRGFVQILFATIIFVIDDDVRNGKVNVFGPNWFSRMMLLCRASFGFGSIGFGFLAIDRLPLGDATVLVMLGPFFASILSFAILGEPWLISERIATLISLTGAILVSKPVVIFQFFESNSTTYQSLNCVGVVFGILASLSAAAAFVTIRILGTTVKLPWNVIAFNQGIGQMLFSLPCMVIFHQHFRIFNLTAAQYVLLFTSAAVASISQAIMTIGLQQVKSASGTAMRMSDVVLSFIFQATLTTDKVNVLSLIGALSVLFSIGIIIVFKPDNGNNSSNSKTIDNANNRNNVTNDCDCNYNSKTNSDSIDIENYNIISNVDDRTDGTSEVATTSSSINNIVYNSNNPIVNLFHDTAKYIECNMAVSITDGSTSMPQYKALSQSECSSLTTDPALGLANNNCEISAGGDVELSALYVSNDSRSKESDDGE